MSGIAVVIATTQGPVEVAAISAEHPDVNSVACMAGSDNELPISAAYNGFVRLPTGLVQRYFEHSAFLLELSGSIDTGESWKLGAFVAHALHYNGRLARGTADADRVVWVTGDIRRDLGVPAVGYVEDKLRRSQALFRELAVRGVPVNVLMPAENAAGFDGSRLAELGIGPDSVVAVNTANDALAALGLPAVVARNGIGRVHRRGAARRRWMVAAAGAVLILAGAAGGIVWYLTFGNASADLPLSVADVKLRDVLYGRTIHGTSTISKRPFVMNLLDGGVATIEMPADAIRPPFKDHGSWWVWSGKNRICYQFTRFSQGKMRCPFISVEDGTITARRGDGTPMNWDFRRTAAAVAR
jgi:hypothetical protein